MPKEDGRARKMDWVRVTVPLALYIVLALTAWKLGLFKTDNIKRLSQSSGIAGVPWIAVAFITLYAAVATLALPVGPLAYAAGALFGFTRASIYVFAASMLGAVAGYFFARTLFAPSARRLLGRYKDKLHDLKKGNVFLTSFRMQLLPILPFGAFNYAAAISKFPPLPFLAGTALGIIPGTLLATLVGDRLLAGVTGSSRRPLFIGLAIAAALVLLSFVPSIVKRIRK